MFEESSFTFIFTAQLTNDHQKNEYCPLLTDKEDQVKK